jgi:hypothetical protein
MIISAARKSGNHDLSLLESMEYKTPRIEWLSDRLRNMTAGRTATIDLVQSLTILID